MSQVHVCTDSCFESKRSSPKHKINCFACGRLSNLRCHSLTSQQAIDAIKSSSNAVFLCNLCYTKVPVNRSNRKSNTPSSTSSSSSAQTAPSVAEGKGYMTKADYANLLKLNENLNGQIKSINEMTNKIHDFMIASNDTNAISAQHASNTHNSLDDNDFKSEYKLTKTTTENIFKLMLKLQPKIESLHTTNDEKNSIQQILNALENRHARPTTTKPTNASLSHSMMENWILSNNDSINESLEVNGRPSVLIRQSIDDDIMEVLKNSDRITWDTLDLLNKAIDKQDAKLESILTHMGIGPNSISSPLVDSIHRSNQSDSSDAVDATIHSATSPNDAVHLRTISLIENTRNDFQKINDKIDKMCDELISALPIQLPQAGRSLIQVDDHPINISSVENGSSQHANLFATNHEDESPPHDTSEGRG